MTVAIDENNTIYSSVRRARPSHRLATYGRWQLSHIARSARPRGVLSEELDTRVKSSDQTAASRSVFDAERRERSGRSVP